MSHDVFAVSTSGKTDLTDDNAQVPSSVSVEVDLIEGATPSEHSRVPVEVVVHDTPEIEDSIQDGMLLPEAAEAIDLEVEPVQTDLPEAAAADRRQLPGNSASLTDATDITDEASDDEASVACIDLSAFEEMGLSTDVMKAILTSGYETPSPIQLKTVPHILAGRDLMGQAETGSGKTAAFAWPILSRIDPKFAKPQVLVLAPTRELAIQVTAAFEKYAADMKGFRAVTIYGGQSYETQLRALSRGVHVVVGTPGRVMDHLRRETLDLSSLKTLVLDEADEMLRMGFIDDVEWILEQIPDQRQILSFSATLPEPIQRIAKKYLNNPAHVSIQSDTATAESIEQSCLFLHPREKMDTLVRLLETEETEGVLVFVKTRNTTMLVAENLIQKGVIASPLNGDIPQNQRERTVNQLKSGRINVVVATDVAARGLDVKRISHVINYDFPHDTEAYVHRIGRTGRAGATGNAILFVEPKEKGKLSRLQRDTNQPIKQFQQKSLDEINRLRVEKFKQRVVDAMDDKQVRFFSKLVSDFQNESGLPFNEIAGALAVLAQGDSPLLLKELAKAKSNWRTEKRPAASGGRGHGAMTTYRVEVGRDHKVGPGNIVGAITNEANLNNGDIGKINIFDRFSTIDLPADLPMDIVEMLKNVQVSGQRLALSKSQRSYAKPGGRRSGPSGGAKYENRSRFGDKKFGEKKFGDKKFGDKKFDDKKFGENVNGEKKSGDKPFGDQPRAEKSYSFKKPEAKKYELKSRDAESYVDRAPADKRPADKKYGGKRPARSNASGSVFTERTEDRYSTYKGKKSFANKPAKPKTKAAERTKAKRKPGAKPSGPMKKYVKIRSSK